MTQTDKARNEEALDRLTALIEQLLAAARREASSLTSAERGVEEPLKAGDYVLATKYSDGDPGDPWGVGFYREKVGGRHLVQDGNGKLLRHSGFMRVGKIKAETGAWLLARAKELEETAAGSVNLWTLVAEREAQAVEAPPPAAAGMEGVGGAEAGRVLPDQGREPSKEGSAGSDAARAVTPQDGAAPPSPPPEVAAGDEEDRTEICNSCGKEGPVEGMLLSEDSGWFHRTCVVEMEAEDEPTPAPTPSDLPAPSPQGERLMPCPCGRHGDSLAPIWNAGDGGWHAECVCGWRGPICKTAPEAVAAWNRRPSPSLPSDVEGVVKRLLERANNPACRCLPDLDRQTAALIEAQAGEIAGLREWKRGLASTCASLERDLERETSEREAAEAAREAAVGAFEQLEKDLKTEKEYVAQWEQRYRDEYAIVARVWKALGISDYAGAKGKAIDELVAEAVKNSAALTILTDLYDSEINANISWFWDAGFDVVLGDRHNGVIGAHNEGNLIAALLWLKDAVVARCPESEFAKKYGRPK